MIDTNKTRELYKRGCTAIDVLALCDELDRLRAPKQQPQGKTVEVRVAVAVHQNGAWYAVGWDGATRFNALNYIAPGGVVSWLTATLPVPEAVEVAATVEGE